MFFCMVMFMNYYLVLQLQLVDLQVILKNCPSQMISSLVVIEVNTITRKKICLFRN